MCTAITLKTNDFYFGRNFDWEFSYGETVTITPRNFVFEFSDGAVCTNHYSIIGTAFVCDNYPLYFDGTNEAGLSIAGLNFPGNACYNESNPDKINIPSYELIPRILSSFDSVEHVLDFIQNINVTDKRFNDKLPPSPLHWIVADSELCYVIEPMHSGLKVIKNDFGVLTNNPSFDYHALNVANYMRLSDREPQNNIASDVPLNVYSRGMGAIGLPGDWSSSSRFVRVVFEKEHSISGVGERESVSQFFHILGNVEHIRGCVRLPEDEYEITQYSSCCNTNKGIYYFTTYENRRINAINMHSENLEGDVLISYPMSKHQDICYLNV